MTIIIKKINGKSPQNVKFLTLYSSLE